MVSNDVGTDPADTLTEQSDTSDRFGRLFNLIGDAVIELEFVETTPVVRAVNPAFEEIFGYDRETVRDESLNEFIIPVAHETESETFDERTAAGKPNHAIVSRKTATGIREFLYRGIPYERADGRRFGFAIYSDITEQRTYERHIHVIHRILRHNLRNELSVILGTAQFLESEAESAQVRDRAAQISDHARKLADLGKEAQSLEKLLTADRSAETIDIAAVCRGTVEMFRESTTATLSLDAPEQLQIRGVPELRTAVEALVENGIVHNTGNATVHVTARYEPKRVVVEIADDGPGIPESERVPALGDQDITQLRHGTGLGLWLARCTVEACDGQIEYDRRDDGWTVLRLVFRPA